MINHIQADRVLKFYMLKILGYFYYITNVRPMFMDTRYMKIQSVEQDGEFRMTHPMRPWTLELFEDLR